MSRMSARVSGLNTTTRSSRLMNSRRNVVSIARCTSSRENAPRCSTKPMPLPLAIVEPLQEQISDARAGLLSLIDEDHRERMLTDARSQRHRAAFLAVVDQAP